MMSLLLAVFAASLVGSLHCAGMCGPLVAFVVGGGERTHRGQSLRLLVIYHLSRGASYGLLGLVVGLIGQLADIAGVLAGLAPLAATLAGITLLWTGAALLARHLGARIPHARLPGPIQAAVRRLQARAMRMPPHARAVGIGATTAMLPCGWLYAFAVTAAGTGAPLKGALVMLAFWAGTVPILGALGIGVQGLRQSLSPALQVAASMALVALGCWTLVGRASLDAGLLVERAGDAAPASGPLIPEAERSPSCCGGGASPTDGIASR